MKKMLPLADTPTETYQGTSFILSILLAYENTKNVYYNNYINLECNNVDDIFEIRLDFAGTSWENYRLSGVADMNMYYLRNIHEEKFAGFIKERIDQGNYILFYNIDEYYLSYSKHFQYDHLWHDTYIYGYDEEKFCVMAYRNRKLSKFDVPIYEIQKGMYFHENADKNLSFCTFRPNTIINESIDLLHIKQSFYNYLDSHYQTEENETKSYGISVYDALIKCLCRVLSDSGEKNSDIDFRPFRLLWEHKKIVKEHILKIIELLKFNSEISIMVEEIESIAEIIFRLVIKYSAVNDALLLKRVIYYLIQMREKEEKFICFLLDEFCKNEI